MDDARKKVLIVSFFFPPNGSAGVQRVLSAINHCHANGWDPIVLTVNPKAYPSTDDSLQIPTWLDNDHLVRTRAFDVLKYFSINGKHFSWTTAIDRWASWIPFAIYAGRKLIKKHKPDLIWSSVPLPSAHIIANSLATYGNIPWVAEYRDPLSVHNPNVPTLKGKIFRWIDEQTIRNCNVALFVSEMAKNAYQKQLPLKDNSAYKVIENGYSEKNWSLLTDYQPQSQSPMSENKFSLLYTGVLYDNGRDPKPLFEALYKLKNQDHISAQNFELVFLGAGDGIDHQPLLKHLNIQDLVYFSPPVSYIDSLYFIQRADALVLIQDSVFNMQVPLKLYEYIRSGKPILVHTPIDSSTEGVAKRYQLSAITQTSDQIESILLKWLVNTPDSLEPHQVIEFSRSKKDQQLIELFEDTVASKNAKQ